MVRLFHEYNKSADGEQSNDAKNDIRGFNFECVCYRGFCLCHIHFPPFQMVVW